MVFPIADDNTGRRITPVVNYIIIAINVFVFVVFQGLGENTKFTFAFSAVPYEILTGKDVETPPRQVTIPQLNATIEVPGLEPLPGLLHQIPFAVYLTLLTSMFMHGGIAHLLGNMWFLWIFGDNIEDALGHFRYLIFYLVCGVLASFAHIFSTVMLFGLDSKEALVPSLGASGAISGVLGGYILLFPHRSVLVVLFRFLTTVPAWVALGIWFLFQIISSLGVLGGGTQMGGVAYGAHIGGFVAGLVLVKLFAIGREPKVEFMRRTPVRPRYRW